MLKFVNTKYKHLYKQPTSPSKPLVFPMNEIDCLGHYFDVILHFLDASTLWQVFVIFVWWITWIAYVCLMRNRWDILRLLKHELINMDLQHLTMHSMPPSLTYIQYFCMYVHHMKNFKKIQSLHEWKIK
jgi:hypothetical protein